MIEFRPATLEDAESLAPRLRTADVEEVRAAKGMTPVDALTSSVRDSDIARTVAVDGLPIVMFGAGPTDLDGLGFVWLLASDDLKRHKRQFLEVSRGYLDILHTYHPVLFNYVDARNRTYIRWLRWAGFAFIHRHESFGVEGRPFLEFVRSHDPTRV